MELMGVHKSNWKNLHVYVFNSTCWFGFTTRNRITKNCTGTAVSDVNTASTRFENFSSLRVDLAYNI